VLSALIRSRVLMSEWVRSVMRVEKRLLEAVYQLFSEKRQWSRPKRRSNLSRFPPPTPPVEDDIGTVVSHGSSSSVALFCHLPIAEYPIQTLLQLITAVNLPGFVGCPIFLVLGQRVCVVAPLRLLVCAPHSYLSILSIGTSKLTSWHFLNQ